MRLLHPIICISLGLAGCQSTAGNALSSPENVTVEATLDISNDPQRLGRMHLSNGNYAMAERHFKDAVEKNSEDAVSWMGLAAAYDQLGRFDLAERAYERVERLTGETLELLNNRGYHFLLQGNGASALRQFERAQAVDPENEIIANNIRLLRLGQRNVRATPL